MKVLLRHGGLALLLALAAPLAWAAKPTWARKATGFSGDCKSGCRSQRIVAPDKVSVVEVLYQDGEPYLRVTSSDKQAREVHDLQAGPWNDLQWAPDSKTFFVSSGERVTSPASLQVYLLDEVDLRGVDVAREAERDMVKTFPPCKAIYDQPACHKIERDPGYNITAIDWAKDATTLVLMIQVPCTSNYGGIMCQLMGYEVEVPSGKIVKRMDPAEFRSEWQKQMAQRLELPEKPQYQ